MTITIIGYRGTGKTTVARLLADLLGCDWFDVDDEIESRAGRSIAEIFSQSGEPAFRDLEEEVVQELTRRDAAVIATGGGSVLREPCRHAMQSAGPVIWLQATAELIDRRLRADPTTGQRRPALTRQGGMAEIAELLESRRTLYEQAATHAIDTAGRAPQQIAEQIFRLLRVDEEAESRNAQN